MKRKIKKNTLVVMALSVMRLRHLPMTMWR